MGDPVEASLFCLPATLETPLAIEFDNGSFLAVSYPISTI
jgi:hypothetical protein